MIGRAFGKDRGGGCHAAAAPKEERAADALRRRRA